MTSPLRTPPGRRTTTERSIRVAKADAVGGKGWAEAEVEEEGVPKEGVVPVASQGVGQSVSQSVGAFIGSVPLERARIRRFTPHLGRYAWRGLDFV